MECCCSSQRFFAITLAVGSNCAEVVLLPPILSPKPDTEQIVADGAPSLAEVCFATRLDILGRVRRKKRTHPNRELVLAPELEGNS